jgi:ribosomal-protein-alanine N-acetyltransferase
MPKSIIQIETKRLIIKLPQLADLDDLYALQSDPDVMRYVGTGVRTREVVQEGLLSNIQHQEKHGFSLGAVYLKETGEFIGRAGLIYLAFDDTQPDIEIGYMLHKNCWNNGYATELAQACIQWGFENLKVNKLVAVIQPENEASQRVLEKLGFCYMGRDIYRDTEVALYEIYKNQLAFDAVKLMPATQEESVIVKNMASFYAYDISRYTGREAGWEFEEDGTYGGPETLSLYWQEPNRYPFLIRVNNELAGFVLVNKIGSAAGIDWNMGEFFIVAKFQGKGLGQYGNSWQRRSIPILAINNKALYQKQLSRIHTYCAL